MTGAWDALIGNGAARHNIIIFALRPEYRRSLGRFTGWRGATGAWACGDLRVGGTRQERGRTDGSREGWMCRDSAGFGGAT